LRAKLGAVNENLGKPESQKARQNSIETILKPRSLSPLSSPGEMLSMIVKGMSGSQKYNRESEVL
jgi:hypothetical protein